MINDDSGLSENEAARWDAIVENEWPIESANPTTQLSSRPAPSGDTDRTARQTFVTVHQPRRPRLTALAVGVSALATTAWLSIQVLTPAYQGADQAGISRSERAVEVHDLTIAAALVAISLVAAASCIGTWAVATARYRLRLSSFRLVASRSTPATVYVRPPNPATAATWILLFLSASTATGWWIQLQLGNTAGSSRDVDEALSLAALGSVAWLAVLLLCAAGLTTWGAREARHRVRRKAARDDRSGDHALGSVAT